jgi:hypothetical protein
MRPKSASCSVGKGIYLHEGKTAGREVNHLLPFGVEVKNEWS